MILCIMLLLWMVYRILHLHIIYIRLNIYSFIFCSYISIDVRSVIDTRRKASVSSG